MITYSNKFFDSNLNVGLLILKVYFKQALFPEYLELNPQTAINYVHSMDKPAAETSLQNYQLKQYNKTLINQWSTDVLD
ncbi:hypothetical protein GCM10027342_52510 [Photobacterium alginatilyticum]